MRAYSSKRKLEQTKMLRTSKNSNLSPLSFPLTFKRYTPQSLNVRGITYYDSDGKERYLITSLKRRSVPEILSFYKRRFHVENAFRDMRTLLLRTYSRDGRVRYTLLLLALFHHHLLHYFFFLVLPPLYLIHNWFYLCPLPQRSLFHLLSTLFQRHPSPSTKEVNAKIR
ncbi:MAG: hypothetical protein ACTSYD_05805 [Candidatus Heimdallarchaeaceae archaeon]